MTARLMKIPHAFWVALDRLDIKRFDVLQQAKLPLSIVKGDAKLSTRHFFDLWQSVESLGGADVGLRLSRSVNPSTMPPSFLVAYYSKTVGDALQRVARFKFLCTAETLFIKEENHSVSITPQWPFANVATPHSLIDATFVSITEMIRASVKQTVNPIQVELRREASTALAEYFQCPIHWESTQDTLYFSSSSLELPFVAYNQELAEILDSVLSAELNQQKALASFSEQVRWLLRRTLSSGRPELKNIARELAISERSLQRYLSKEGESFQSLLSTTRHHLACEYLQDKRLDIAEIAYMLGYEDQGSFYRAFQNWERLPPARWRDLYAKEIV